MNYRFRSDCILVGMYCSIQCSQPSKTSASSSLSSSTVAACDSVVSLESLTLQRVLALHQSFTAPLTFRRPFSGSTVDLEQCSWKFSKHFVVFIPFTKVNPMTNYFSSGFLSIV
ncbi:hypothetical protein EMCRGX_G025843 [Ephydatia muelleri]